MRILIATPLLLWAVMRSDTNKVWVHTTNPRASSLYQPFDSHYETVKAMREQRFERQYGFWRRRSNGTVAASLDCGCSNPDVHNHTTVYPSDTEGLDRLACHVTPSRTLPKLAQEAAEQWTGGFNPRPFDEAAALEVDLDVYRGALGGEKDSLNDCLTRCFFQGGRASQ